MASNGADEKAFGAHNVSSNPQYDDSRKLSPKDDSDLDDNYDLYQRIADVVIDPREARKVLWKIDLRVMPILVVVYFLQYLDKKALNYASAYGLREHANLKGNEFAWCASVFYFGYMAAQYPAAYLMQRLPIAKVLSCAVIAWSIVLLTTPACHNFAGLMVSRFLLGAFEAFVNPGFVSLLSYFFTKKEQPLRLEIYYCTNGIATMFGGLISYAIGFITHGLPRWMYIFIIFGSVSMASGLWSLFYLPDAPATAKFLNEHERAIAVERVAENRQGLKNSHFKTYQLWQVFRDPKTWMLFIMAVGAQVPNAALTSFASIVIDTFGFGTLGSQYLQIPGGAVQFLALICGGIICAKLPNFRCITMIVANSICILGSALLVALPNSNRWGRLVALWLCYFQSLGFSMSLTMVSSNVAGTTKKQITGAVLFTGYCVGNIVGPQTFRESEAPGYESAYIAMLVGYTIKLGMIVVLYIYMFTVNKKRDREAAAAGTSPEDEERAAIERGMHDMTEIDNKGFRYVL